MELDDIPVGHIEEETEEQLPMGVEEIAAAAPETTPDDESMGGTPDQTPVSADARRKRDCDADGEAPPSKRAQELASLI